MLLAWQLRYLGWQTLLGELPPFEIERFLTLSGDDLRAVRSRYNNLLRLGVALQSCLSASVSAGERFPAYRAGDPSSFATNLVRYAWKPHCRGLFETLVAA